MRILVVAEFDPCQVHAQHRSVLRSLGVDYRLAVTDLYNRYNYGHDPLTSSDWIEQVNVGLSELKEFAATADIVQWQPGIGQPWSYTTSNPSTVESETRPFAGLDIRNLAHRARHVAFIHGSRNVQINRAHYAKIWRDEGCVLIASTLDYAMTLPAIWMPPTFDYSTWEPVPLREMDDPLVVTHTPTDPENSHARALQEACSRLGLPLLKGNGKLPWEEAMALKQRGNCGFDHLRGSFSINTLENAALGLAPLVGLHPQYRARCELELDAYVGQALPELVTEADLFEKLRTLRDDPVLTATVQVAARNWIQTAWNVDRLGQRMLKLYEGIANGQTVLRCGA